MKALPIAVILAYLLGQGTHILLNEVNTVRSKLNAITTWKGYFQNQGVFILIRLVVTTAMFLVVWENPKILGLDQINIGPLTRIGAAVLMGWSMDSVFEKFTALFGWAPELPKA